MKSINVQRPDGAAGSVTVESEPNFCPICHHAIEALVAATGFLAREDVIEQPYRCPRRTCNRTFIARYMPIPGGRPPMYVVDECVPRELRTASFSEIVTRVSEKFCEIHKQADSAEQLGLTLVCGPGYRKALEFLVKDYAISIHPDQADEIKKSALAQCIRNFIKHDKIVAMASRAAWLGNDETHYLRTWEDHDLNDLKTLIRLTTHWIEMEEMTKEIEREMPDPKTKAPSTTT